MNPDQDALQEKLNFDIEIWRNEGRTAYQELVSKEEKLEKELLHTRKQRIELEEGLSALGLKPKGKQKISGHKGKIMIRPIVLQYLIDHEDKEISMDTLVDIVQEEKPKATVSSIEQSVIRLARDMDNVTRNKNKIKYTSNSS